MTAITLDLDVSRLAGPSKLFASRLLHRLPELETHARMKPSSEPDEFDLWLEIPSPSGDPKRKVVMWMEEGVEPSLGFGEWHSHAGVERPGGDLPEQADAIIDLIRAILADQVVLIYDIGGEHDGSWGLIDLRDQDALLEELTSKYSPGRVKIRTWSGRDDREVGLEDLSVDPSP